MNLYKLMFLFSSFVFFTLSVFLSGGCQQGSELTATVGADEQGTNQVSSGKFLTHADVFSPSTFAARRTRLAESIPGGVVVLFGEKGVIDAWDEHRHNSYFRVQGFRQEENLFYLTGLSMPGVAIVLTPKSAMTRVYVPRVTDKVAAELTRLGLGEPIPMERFETDLDNAIGQTRSIWSREVTIPFPGRRRLESKLLSLHSFRAVSTARIARTRSWRLSRSDFPRPTSAPSCRSRRTCDG